MKRIDSSTKAVDLFGSGKHGYQDGNPGLGILATALNASVFNNVQEEIAGVVEAAGITLDGAVYTQLKSALTAGWGMAKSLATNGYATMPGGIILQWGKATQTGGASFTTTTFPMAFPTACLHVSATAIGNAGVNAETTELGVVTATTFQHGNVNSEGFGYNATIHWIALGY